MVFDNEKANIDIDPVNVFYGESEEECGIITNQKFYNNFKNVSAIGSYFNGENYYYTSKDDTVCIRIYCKEASDEVLFYGYSSTLFYGLDYENYSTQQFDGENYYYDFTFVNDLLSSFKLPVTDFMHIFLIFKRKRNDQSLFKAIFIDPTFFIKN